MPENKAAWIRAPKSRPFEIEQAPYPSPRENEFVIRNRAVAVNPLDWLLQLNGSSLSFPWLTYPGILGGDVAGEVVEVGSKVTRYKVGDRVMGFAVGHDPKRNNYAEAGFQLYTVLLDYMTTPLPHDMSFEKGCVVPLGAATAAAGLFQDDMLALQRPSASKAQPVGKTLLIWGGSTSVGCNAIQLAVAAGYEVFTTCSPRNFDFVKRLGASKAFDYRSKTVVEDIVHAFKNRTAAGAYSIGQGAADACFDVLNNVSGNKFIAMATYPVPTEPSKRFALLNMIYHYVSWSILAWIKSKTRGIRFKFIFGSTVLHNNVGRLLYEHFLPSSLATGLFVPEPAPMVVGSGLEHLQEALDIQRRGVSAKKVVVTL